MQTLNVLDNRFSPFNTFSTLTTNALNADAITHPIYDKRQSLILIKQLQTTLDLDELLTIFSIEASKYFEFSALHFQNKVIKKALRGSRKAKKERLFDLKIGNELLGTIAYGIDTPISLSTYKIITQLHQCLLYPIKNALAFHHAMQLAMQDGLTGLGNRRYFDEQLKRAMHNANRHRSLVGLVLGDLNKFKAINDTFGHVIGDQVLKEFSHVIRECIRDSDSPFRFGGDEFAILVENADESALSIIESRISNALTNNVLLNKYQVGCSIGATYMNNDDNEFSFFERADKALYQKKLSS